ncbi:hypothetical protein L2E82_25588 [Cichorium intybus]|uniref:Uncharacterized protein n=1 Tax=Cichorium intybus TaxID=13427 RepID=A0ACB9E3G0_CICIN|nr:hypothetical protein L2E82_25588 [Cichorium intybus]
MITDWNSSITPWSLDAIERLHNRISMLDVVVLIEEVKNDEMASFGIPKQIVIYEFVNHGGVIFKVYVVGKYVKCMKRKSLPDIAEEKLESLHGSLSFSQVSNLTSHDINDDKYYKMMDLEDAAMPPMSLITNIARGLRKAMKLHIFNFD